MANAAVNYKCPNCSAPLSFLPGHDKVTCEYCGTEFDVSVIEDLFRREEEMAQKAAKQQDAKWESEAREFGEDEAKRLRAFTCSSCGAEIVADENTMATECVYCGNPTMLPGRFDGALKPQYVIPFKKTKEEAQAALKEFYKGKLLLPDAFTKNNRVEAIQPMYVPFWLFDADTEAAANFEAEIDHYYETANECVTETEVYACQREGAMSFKRIPVDGSKKMDDDYMDSIEPYDYRDLEPFSAAYLTGYLADKFDVEADDCAERVDRRMENTTVDVLAESVTGYDRVNVKNNAFIKQNQKVSYCLAPVWILSTKYEGKAYTFMMNGQTGKMVGSLPYDKTKAMLYPAIAAVLSFPIMYALATWLLEG